MLFPGADLEESLRRGDHPHLNEEPDVANIALTTRIERNPDLIATDMDGEVVMMSIAKGKYYGIDATGSDIWGWLEKPLTVAEIAEKLCAVYEVDEATAQADTLAFVAQMLEHEVVQVC